MAVDPLSVLYPATGVFMSDAPVLFSPQALGSGVPYVYMATNMRIEDSMWRTRTAWRELTPSEELPGEWMNLSTQGAVWYNPRLGSGPIQMAGEPGIIESCGGKLYKILIDGTQFRVRDISNGIVARPSMRLAWLACGENYVIRTDGTSLTQIYDGFSTSTSTGYNRNAPLLSRLPNFAGPVAYTDRFWIVDRQRDVIAGDHLHRIDQLSASDLLKTTDQTYDSTAKSFPPPANLGNIHSMFVVTGTRGGSLPSQAEVISGTDGPGTWGVLGGTPRSEWATTPMCRVVHPEIGPVGPYAAYAGRNELLMRTQEGISSLKYYFEEVGRIGNPVVNLGQEVKPLLDADPKDLLLFATVANPSGWQRCAFSVYPVVDGTDRWHRGYITATMAPSRTRVPDAFVWEGVQTLPESMGELIQFIHVAEFGEKRLLALLRKPDGTKTLAEWTRTDGPDQLADGTTREQTWQILTRKLTLNEYGRNTWKTVFMRLQHVRGKINLRLSARFNEHECFREQWCREFENQDWKYGKRADSVPITLGSLEAPGGSPWVQFLIEGEGSCAIDFAVGDVGTGKPYDTPSYDNLLSGSCCNYRIFKRSS